MVLCKNCKDNWGYARREVVDRIEGEGSKNERKEERRQDRCKGIAQKNKRLRCIS